MTTEYAIEYTDLDGSRRIYSWRGDTKEYLEEQIISGTLNGTLWSALDARIVCRTISGWEPVPPTGRWGPPNPHHGLRHMAWNHNENLCGCGFCGFVMLILADVLDRSSLSDALDRLVEETNKRPYPAEVCLVCEHHGRITKNHTVGSSYEQRSWEGRCRERHQAAGCPLHVDLVVF